MAQTERLYRLKAWLDAGHCLPRDQLLRDLAISPATLKRDLAHLRDRMNAPVVFDKVRGGYRWDNNAQLPGTQYELPGLWLSADEIHALLTMQHLLANLDTAGLLGPHIEPLAQRLDRLLGTGTAAKAGGIDARAEVRRRILVQTVGARQVKLPCFQAVGTALLRRQRVVIGYHGRGRGRDEHHESEVSPQRLIHYRDNWYLDAWCHWRRALRSFSVDAITAAQVLEQAAIDVPETELDAVLGAGYGIFSGKAVQWARLRFSTERARWVSAETWHPQQRASWDEQRRWTLELPYADSRELEMDILRHLPHVEVLGPETLRLAVIDKLKMGLQTMAPGLMP